MATDLMHQATLTIIAQVKRDALDALKQLLGTMAGQPGTNAVIPIGALPDVHFARFVVLDPSTDPKGEAVEPSLLFLSDFDGPPDRQLQALVDLAPAGLDQLYGHCSGYPAAGAATRETRLAFLKAHCVQAGAIYVNTIGRSVRQIRQEAELRVAIEDYLDSKPGGWRGTEPAAVRGAIQRHVSGEPGLRWAQQPVPAPSLAWRLQEAGHLAGVAALLLVLSPLILIGFPIWLLVLRLHELRDRWENVKPDDAWVQYLASLEDHVVQNQFSGAGFVKPGLFRRLTVLTVFWLTNFGARHFYGHGQLAGVKTIHFARWVAIDGGRRVFFAPNYDGSLEQYMGDFIDKVAWGLNAHDSNGVGYPKTSWLIFGGANDEQAFKNFIHTHQVPTQVWYTAYDQLTNDNIGNNAAIRAGLYGELSAGAATAWLRRL